MAGNPNWIAGTSGNPSGRAKDSNDRARISKMFLHDLKRHWRENGVKAIADAQEHNPAKFMQIVASLLPRDATLTLNVSGEFIEALKIINARRRDREGMGQVLDGRAEVRHDLLESLAGAVAEGSADDD